MSAQAWRRERAERVVEDVIRTFPTGAPTIVLVDRLVRVGVSEGEAHSILGGLERSSRIASEQGRWVLGVTS